MYTEILAIKEIQIQMGIYRNMLFENICIQKALQSNENSLNYIV